MHLWAVFNDVLFWTLVFVLAWTAYILAFHGGVPNIGTAPAIANEAAKVLKNHFGDKPFTVVDPGSGDGSFTRAVASQIPNARVTGVEYTRQSYLWAQMQKRLRRLGNLEYKHGDMFAYDFSTVDAVIMYQSLFWMERLGKKLNAELKPGTIVICNRFPLGDNWQPEQHLRVKTLYPHQKDIYIYKKA